MQAIGPIRNSRTSDDTTSPMRQRSHIDAKASEVGAAVIAYPADMDVSAMRYSPFDRPELGPWMTDPERLSRYDVLIVWRWDRFVRSGQDMRDVFSWARQYQKIIYSATENLKFDPSESNPIDRIISELLITVVTIFAEIEVTNTSTRFKDMMNYLRAEGRPLGGTPPFGMEPGVEGGKKTWVVSDRTAPIVYEIERRILSGEGPYDIARDFTSRGILTPKDWSRVFRGKPPRGAEWRGSSIKRMFATDALLGYRVERDPDDPARAATVRDADGNPVQLCAPVLSRDDGSPAPERLHAVQRALATPPRSRAGDLRNPLAGVLLCYECGAQLHAANTRSGGRVNRYLTCSNAYRGKGCSARGLIRLDYAQRLLRETYLALHGDEPVVERIYVPEQDRSAELSELRTAYDSVQRALERASDGEVIDRLVQRLEQLSEQIKSIESSDTATGWQVRELGETNTERWESSDWDGRREMLLRAGVALRLKRTPRTEQYTFELVTP